MDACPKPHGGGRARAVDEAGLQGHSAAHPDARLVDRVAAWELRSGLRVQVSTMWLALRRIGWTHQKRPVARERDHPEVIEKRALFAAYQAQLDMTRLVFLDESGFRLGSPLRYSWALRWELSPGRVVRGRWETLTMLGAIALDGFRGVMTIDAGTGNEVFQAFVAQELVPRLRPHEIVIMDNLAAHRNAAALPLIRAAGCEVVFLPPYSPEYNPIENPWAKIKAYLRRANTLCRDAFDHAVDAAMARVSPADVRAWIRHAGYPISAI